MRRPEFLPLPGISTRDPNFYEGADYGDRERFAQPTNNDHVLGGVIDIGIDRAATPGLAGDQSPTNEPTGGQDPSPFKIGAGR